MQLLPDGEFLRWLEAGGITNDPRWPRAQALTFGELHEHRRWWLPSEVVSELPSFIGAALVLSSTTGPYWLYRHGGGIWYDGDDGTLRNQIIDRMVSITGIPSGFAGAVGLALSEWRDILILTTAFYVFGWSVGEDLYIIPDDRSCILMISHHGELSVDCASAAQLEAFVQGMREAGYDLPDHLPDGTFKRPDWMVPDTDTA